MKNILSKFSSVVLILAMVVGMVPMQAFAGASDLSISCDSVSVSGNTWTLSGTWQAIDFGGTFTQYDTAIFSPSGTEADDSSKDSPDTFSIVQGPIDFAGAANKDDMSGTWSNQVTFNTVPTSVSAALYHAQVPGGETSGDSFCTFDINDAPVLTGVPTSDSIPEMSPYTFTATATDVDVPAQTLTFSLLSAPAGASIGPVSGTFTWTPTEAQGPGSYPFTVRVSDGVNNTDANIALTVTEVNVAPVSSSASVTTSMNTSVNINLSATDSDLPANTLTITTTDPSNGTLNFVSGNQYSYTPNTDFVGSDSFTYKVNDTMLDSSTATISITVSNDAPTLAAIEDKTVDEETMLSFIASGTDTNEDTLTYSLGAGAPAGASIDSGTGEFTWTPTEAQGPNVYSVTVNVTDGAATDSKTFNITVNEVNVAPVANDDTATTAEDTATTVTLTATDSDIPAQSLAFSIVTAPSNGTANLSGSDVLYTPNANYFGTDTFTFKANDGVTDSNTATITITVTSVNDQPTVELNGSSTVTVTTGDTFTDPGAMCSDVEDSELSLNVSGEVNTQVPGTYTLTYDCTDSNESTSDPVTRTVTVQDAPAMCSDGIDNDEDGKIDFGGQNPDPGCESASDNNETDPVVTPPTPPSGGGGGAPGAVLLPPSTPAPVIGRVLGASTSCEIYVKKYLRRGYKNDPVEVTKLQEFLKENVDSNVVVSGVFDKATEKAVKKFQLDHKDEVLKPWKLTVPTGIAYLTTIRAINNIKCPDLALPMPTNLIPFNKNPETPKI